jgi:hypothetical protein
MARAIWSGVEGTVQEACREGAGQEGGQTADP